MSDKKREKNIRRRLVLDGIDEAEIERILASKRSAWAAQAEQDREWRERNDADKASAAIERARIEDETYRRLSPDDSKHKPRRHDGLRTGRARVTGTTAVVAGRKMTVTKWQHREMEGKQVSDELTCGIFHCPSDTPVGTLWYRSNGYDYVVEIGDDGRPCLSRVAGPGRTHNELAAPS